MLRVAKIIFLLFFACGLYAQETEKLYLSGTGSDNPVKWEFFCTAGMNSGKWTTIPVPSCWELQSFGKYDYGFAKDTVRGKEKGMYRYRFNVPAAWKNKIVKIVFEGAMTDTEVKINGKPAGVAHQGAYYAFNYEITSLLRFGQSNLLEVTVAKHSANESVNAAERRGDFWIFGGIFRPVYLQVLPQQHIEHVAIDAKAGGKFESIVKFNGPADWLKVQLLTLEGKQFGNITYTMKLQPQAKDAAFHLKFEDPLLWSPEFPNLYQAVFTLYRDKKVVHTLSQRFGFRTVELRQRDGIYVNGIKIKFKGVNRHSFRPESGRTTSKAISIEDVMLMKDMNMNAVRMSHYPPDGHFLDVCDSLGLFVMDELAGWHGHYDTETGKKLLSEMILHDVNHPSIVFWSNGNEGGHNLALDSSFQLFDIQKRPVLHPWQLYNGIETQHYREYNYGIGNYDNGHEIVMPTEFLHGLYDGGHGAGLEDYWEAMWRKPLSAGGFLWDFADQGVVRTDKNGMLDTDGNRGADGIVGPHHEKEGSYFAIKEIWSPVHVERREISAAFDGVLNIENRYHFTNIDQCKFSWELKKWTGGVESVSGVATAPAIAPLEKGKLQISLPNDWSKYDVLYVTAKDPHNREIFTWSFPIQQPATVFAARYATAPGKVTLEEHDSMLIAKAGNMAYSIHSRTGMLVKVQKSGIEIPFNNGPVLEEGVNNFKNITHQLQGDTLIITSTFNRKSSYNTLQWKVFPGGMLQLQVNYFPAEYFTSMVGVNFSFPEKDIKGVQYMGYGPYRVWKNRMKGNRFGVWNKAYNNTETGESPWIYPEFKGYHANMYWCRFYTASDSFEISTGSEDVFLRLFTPAFKTDQWRNYELMFPKGDISFMQGIPGIGTKTQRNETTGPMGMKNIYYDYEKDPARWKQLTLYFNFDLKK